MEKDAKVLEALALLKQAGRMDLLREEALVPGRPARRASAGVAAAVAACSPPRPAGGAQDTLDFEEEDPGEEEAARTPWEEAKAGPGAGSRMSSAGRRGRRREAADASSGRCGFFAPDTAAWEEQRPGPSGIQPKRRGEYTGCVVCGGCGAHDARGTVVRDEVESDVSLEEGELRNSGREADWWERKGRGDSNPVRKSFQVEHTVGRPGGSQKERVGGEARKIKGGELTLGSAQEVGLGAAIPMVGKGEGRGNGRGLDYLGSSGFSRRLPAEVWGHGEVADVCIDLPGDRKHDSAGDVGAITPPVGNDLNPNRGGEQDALGDKEWELDFDERSIEEGELSEGWEKEEWWADGRGWGALLALLLSHFRR
ncbi:hypothetical protein NDU88_007396 [Pleurodeles waltl]|uniref:Uncharacterized protein n=1 Tax=Pleurodeles waltl TaxID=8319 RepID=A0AAV7PPS9_PLEWA|nr:hypothetical protein NDU88_007396 [Pleurodeles waltl]